MHVSSMGGGTEGWGLGGWGGGVEWGLRRLDIADLVFHNLNYSVGSPGRKAK